MMLLDEICRNPGSSFNELSEKLKIPKGLLAYHLAFLRRVALVDLEYERRGKKVSSYTPTKGGLQVQKRIKDESK
jgi:predicted transcriptional regulator